MTSVVGVIKNILTTVVGAVVFPDYQASLLNVVALSVSTVGATWYAVHAARKKASDWRPCRCLLARGGVCDANVALRASERRQ